MSRFQIEKNLAPDAHGFVDALQKVPGRIHLWMVNFVMQTSGWRSRILMSSNAVYPVPPTIPTLIIVLGFLNSVIVSDLDFIGLRVKRTSGRPFRQAPLKRMLLLVGLKIVVRYSEPADNASSLNSQEFPKCTA